MAKNSRMLTVLTASLGGRFVDRCQNAVKHLDAVPHTAMLHEGLEDEVADLPNMNLPWAEGLAVFSRPRSRPIDRRPTITLGQLVMPVPW